MKMYVVVLYVFCVFFMPIDAHGEEENTIFYNTKQKKARWSLGLDLADFTAAFFELDGIHVPVNIVAGYDFTDNFQAHTTQVMRFPMRGGYVYVPTLGLRAHSNSIYGLTFFLGTDVGYTVTNVPWLKSGFLMKAHVGSRYVFNFQMYLEGGIGGNFAISADEMRPSYFLTLGYML